METRIRTKLEEFYYGIVAFGTTAMPFFGVVDFAGLAASAVNQLVKTGEVSSWNKTECNRYMVELFNRGIGNSMGQQEINLVVDYMGTISGIDPNIGGILAAIRMAK